MSFCIVIKDETKCLAASFFSQHFNFEHYQIIDEVIEVVNNYNELINKYSDKTELALHILNTRKNMERCGYPYGAYEPMIDFVSDKIIRKKYPSFPISDNKSDYRVISINETAIEHLLESSTHEIEINIAKNKIMLNIYDIIDKSEVIEKMGLNKDFDLDGVSYLSFNLLDVYMYELEDIKNYLKSLETNILREYKSDMYYVPGKKNFIKIKVF